MSSPCARTDDGKAGRADHHAIGGDGHVGFPVRSFAFRRDVPRLHHPAVGHDVVGRGRGDDEFGRRLVVGMVHAGEPVPGPVRPVIREHRPVPELVLLYEQAIGGLAVIDHCHRNRVALRMAVPQRNTQPAVPVRKGRICPCDRHPVHGERDEVEGKDPAADGLQLRQDRGLALDGPAGFADVQSNPVMEYIHVIEPRVTVAGQAGPG